MILRVILRVILILILRVILWHECILRVILRVTLRVILTQSIFLLPPLGPAGFYSHWGITMHSDAPAKGDRIGQLGGYKRGAFKCKDGSIPSSAKGATKLYY